MKTTNLTVSILLISVVLIGVNAIDRIWLSPLNVSITLSTPLFLNSDGVPKGEWVSLETGIIPRSSSLVEIDSKGLIWVISGYSGDFILNTVWNYDPKTDRYRWVSGRPDLQEESYTVYGDFGVPSADAFPGSISASAHTIDKDDNIWIYGNEQLPRHDFWRFNTSSFEFTYFGIANGSVDPIVVTAKGVPSPYNYPGDLQRANLLADSRNNLWLVGGLPNSLILEYTSSAIWHFNTTSLMWTWMWGSTEGPESVSFENNYYNGRFLAGGFIDPEDRIWLFGGGSAGADGSLDSADLWSFDTKTLEWRVEWGSIDSFMTNGSIVSNDFNIGNFPSSRHGAQLVDRLDGTLMIVGGYMYKYSIMLNDIWLFNKTSKLWKNIYGVSVGEAVASSYTNYREPGSLLGTRRYYGAPSGPNTRGHYIMFGGVSEVGSDLNDLWIIPQNPCALCDVNADCNVVDIWSDACTCKQGYSGDGKTCTADVVPVAPVANNIPVSDNGPVTKAPQSKSTSDAPTLASFGLSTALIILAIGASLV